MRFRPAHCPRELHIDLLALPGLSVWCAWSAAADRHGPHHPSTPATAAACCHGPRDRPRRTEHLIKVPKSPPNGLSTVRLALLLPLEAFSPNTPAPRMRHSAQCKPSNQLSEWHFCVGAVLGPFSVPGTPTPARPPARVLQLGLPALPKAHT